MYCTSQNEEQVSWGIHINHTKKIVARSYPKWVQGMDRSTWDSMGVIIWNKQINKVFRLTPHQALDVLDELRESSTWKDIPFYLNWTSYSMPFSEEDRKEWRKTKNCLSDSPKDALAFNGMILAPEQTQELSLFLERHENEIRTLADTYVDEAKKILGKVYALIISWKQNERNKEKQE